MIEEWFADFDKIEHLRLAEALKKARMVSLSSDDSHKKGDEVHALLGAW